ncbi:glucose-1-phosphate thymidylyltransferase [Brevibacillus choshinensis]|uniref:Glucose-1-phosphate thymidylyltransferase n=1 Tax=Brevibacillus choshinensis TaxID=54911 RepID=A0ABR5NCS2_BRECH|nr:glucose-1-phosphate thymidylyltransferase [Brevibacillus choshinensis]KQL49344.1 glucose-1-phosphate thymidylyltransferase [Brevibacillus choshinensis]
MKGLILCAGRGTRLHPFSYSQPKTLLPVANHPVLHYCIRKLREVGVHDIGIVIHPSQVQIPPLVGDGSQFGATITFIEQKDPLGIAHAVQLAQPFLLDEPFILLLGDNLLMDSLHGLTRAFSGTTSDGVVMLSEVERPQDYGIAEVQEGRLVSVEEKPREPKSNLAVIGAYLFTKPIFESIATLQPSARGELEITDAIQSLIDRGFHISHAVTTGKYSDVGTIDRWLEANRWMLTNDLGDQHQIGKDSIVENCDIVGPVLIGDGCQIKNSRLGPFVSIQNGVQLENCAHIENSILLENSSLSDVAWKVSDSVFGRSSQLTGHSTESSGVIILSDKSSIRIPAIKREEP